MDEAGYLCFNFKTSPEVQIRKESDEKSERDGGHIRLNMPYLIWRTKIEKVRQANMRSQITIKNKSIFLQKIMIHHLQSPKPDTLSSRADREY